VCAGRPCPSPATSPPREDNRENTAKVLRYGASRGDETGRLVDWVAIPGRDSSLRFTVRPGAATVITFGRLAVTHTLTNQRSVVINRNLDLPSRPRCTSSKPKRRRDGFRMPNGMPHLTQARTTPSRCEGDSHGPVASGRANRQKPTTTPGLDRPRRRCSCRNSGQKFARTYLRTM
jgi:hypothetical protein